jgi:tRNA-dihydrouridine synthase B
MSIAPFFIDSVKIDPGLVLAPMSGVTTTALRQLIKELNPDSVGLVVSEFISVEGLTRGSMRSAEMMYCADFEHPFAVQIFGYDIDRMRDAALMAQDSGADIVDINCGCPAPKVVKRGGGCELMRQPLHLAKMYREVKSKLSIPLTTKFRSGWDDSCLNALEIGKIAQEEGLSAVTVHGRTRAQLYRGSADWDIAEKLASELSIPVCGSGDIIDVASAKERFSSKIAGYYIGRGALFNPKIFSDIAAGSVKSLTSLEETTILLRYIEILKETLPAKAWTGKVKQLATQMSKGRPWLKPLLRLNDLELQVSHLNAVANALHDNEGALLLESENHYFANESLTTTYNLESVGTHDN